MSKLVMIAALVLMLAAALVAGCGEASEAPTPEQQEKSAGVEEAAKPKPKPAPETRAVTVTVTDPAQTGYGGTISVGDADRELKPSVGENVYRFTGEPGDDVVLALFRIDADFGKLCATVAIDGEYAASECAGRDESRLTISGNIP